MDTGKNVRENYGNVTRTVFAREGQVVVFVPTAKISSFVTTFKQRLENNSNTAGKGFSGIYLKKDETEEFKEWRGWWYWYNYHKGYYVDLTGN
jgi:peptidase E